MDKYAASPLAVALAILSNVTLHNLWTFKALRTGVSLPIRALKFSLVSIGTLAVSYSTFVGMSVLYPALPPQVSQLAGIIPATIVNYFLNAYWTSTWVAATRSRPTFDPSSSAIEGEAHVES